LGHRTRPAGRDDAGGPAGSTWLALASLAAAAVLLDLGTIHRLEHADTLLPVLISLQRWTPFYWGQDRYGMLVPLLAMPLRDPLSNLLLQRAIGILAGFGTVLLLARFSLSRGAWLLAGAIAVATLLLAAPDVWFFTYVADTPYGIGLAPGLLGLLVAGPGPDGRVSLGRSAAGLGLLLVASWINFTAPVALGFLVLARAAGERLLGREGDAVLRRLLLHLGLLAISMLAAMAAARLYGRVHGVPATGGALQPPWAWPTAWWLVLGRTWANARPLLWADAGMLALGLALLSRSARRAALRDAAIRAALLLGAAIAYAAVIGATDWIARNEFHFRYLIPSVLVAHVAAASVLAAGIGCVAGNGIRRAAGATLLVTIPILAILTGGRPSFSGVRNDLDQATGTYADDVLASRCQLIAGDYWSVWPAVWHQALRAHEQRLGWKTWGLAFRGEETAPFWRASPEGSLRLCALRGDRNEKELATALPELHRLTRVERRRSLDVFRFPGR
jgi:hypothetical protein